MGDIADAMSSFVYIIGNTFCCEVLKPQLSYDIKNMRTDARGVYCFAICIRRGNKSCALKVVNPRGCAKRTFVLS